MTTILILTAYISAMAALTIWERRALRRIDEKYAASGRRIDEDHAVVMLGIGLVHAAKLQELGLGRVVKLNRPPIYDVN